LRYFEATHGKWLFLSFTSVVDVSGIRNVVKKYEGIPVDDTEVHIVFL